MAYEPVDTKTHSTREYTDTRRTRKYSFKKFINTLRNRGRTVNGRERERDRGEIE